MNEHWRIAVKTTKAKYRTKIADISAVGFELTAAHLGMVVGGMICEPGWTEYTTDTLNSQGRSDTQTDCKKSL